MAIDVSISHKYTKISKDARSYPCDTIFTYPVFITFYYIFKFTTMNEESPHHNDFLFYTTV